MNTTAGVSSSQSFPSLINPVAEKLEKTVAYTPIAVLALAGNSLIGIIVCKTPTLRKQIHPLIVNMAMSDLLYPIVLTVSCSTGGIARWLVPYWWCPWSGLGQATRFPRRCLIVSIDSEPDSDNSGSIRSCCSSTPFLPHQSQAL